MPKTFPLPCPHCDQKLEVEGRHAGQSQKCPHCDSMVDVPTFRELKSLAAEDTSESRAPAPVNTGQSTLKGILFTVGLGLAVVAGVGGWFLYNYASDMVERYKFDTDSVVDSVNAPVDDATVVELWDVWQATIDGGDLPDWQEPIWKRYYTQGKILTTVAYIIFGLAAVGLIMMMSSFMVTHKST